MARGDCLASTDGLPYVIFVNPNPATVIWVMTPVPDVVVKKTMNADIMRRRTAASFACSVYSFISPAHGDIQHLGVRSNLSGHPVLAF